jgi:hypothetical protein
VGIGEGLHLRIFGECHGRNPRIYEVNRRISSEKIAQPADAHRLPREQTAFFTRSNSLVESFYDAIIAIFLGAAMAFFFMLIERIPFLKLALMLSSSTSEGREKRRVNSL